MSWKKKKKLKWLPPPLVCLVLLKIIDTDEVQTSLDTLWLCANTELYEINKV